MVADPTAVKPTDWDDSMDGSWEAPLINNPKCAAAPGCGLFSPPLIDNPKFQGKNRSSYNNIDNLFILIFNCLSGKWKAPMISNPNYKGKWTPAKIPNPDYFEDKEPFKMTSIVRFLKDLQLFYCFLFIVCTYIGSSWFGIVDNVGSSLVRQLYCFQ
jgi:calnexin